jgi:hypothetical protein
MVDGLAVQVLLESPSMTLAIMRATFKTFIGDVIAR